MSNRTVAEVYLYNTDPSVYNPITGERPGWADPPDPRDLPEGVLEARIAESVRPEDWIIDEHGRPVDTSAPDDAPDNRGKLGGWCTNNAAELVTVAVAPNGKRYTLLGYRDDAKQWSLLGGMVDDGERATAAMVREIREETGVDVSAIEPKVLYRMVANDIRNTRHARIETTGGLALLPYTPTPHADGVEIQRVDWFEIPGTVDELIAGLPRIDEDHQEGLFASHADGLRQAFKALRQFDETMQTADAAQQLGWDMVACNLRCQAAALVPESVEKGIALRAAATSAEQLNDTRTAVSLAAEALTIHDKFLGLVAHLGAGEKAVLLRERAESAAVLGRLAVG